MTDTLRWDDVSSLIHNEAAPCVSVYLPTHRVSDGRDLQDPIRLRHLLDAAEAELLELGARGPDAAAILEPARAVQLAGEDFWRAQGEGLAVHLAPGTSAVRRLADSVPELVVVGDRFHVSPLLALLARDCAFLVLALSQKSVRLLECTRHDWAEVPLPGAPLTLAEVLAFDDLERERTFHVAARGGPGAVAIMHGQSVGGEADKALLERWVRAVDEGVAPVLAGRREPLVLAGVAYEQAMFRQVTRYPAVLDRGVDGNPEQERPDELQRLAWPLVEPGCDAAVADAVDRFARAAAHGGRAASGVADVLAAAEQGRVDTVLLPVGEQRWGRVGPSGAVESHPRREAGDEDLLDRIAVATLRTGGQVLPVDRDRVPGPGPAAAILRY
jgi:hypothetical protein